MTTINTCTSSTRPSSPLSGDTLFETDSESLITYDGSAWKSYAADDGNYNLDGTNITSTRPLCHFDAEYFNGLDASGNPANDTSINTSTVWKCRVDTSTTLAQDVASKMPLYKTSGTNSKPYVYCDGGDVLYLSSDKIFKLHGELTAFSIAEHSNSRPATIFGGAGGDNSPSSSLFFGFDGNTYYLYFSQTGAANGTAPVVSGTDMQSLMISRDSSNDTKLFMDGSNQGSAVGTNTDPQVIGSVFVGGGNQYGMVGNVYEFMLFSTSLSNADRNALGAYAQAKYGSSNVNWTDFS